MRAKIYASQGGIGCGSPCGGRKKKAKRLSHKKLRRAQKRAVRKGKLSKSKKSKK